MEAWRIAKAVYSKDLSGQGAAIYGGRWNSRDIRMVYLAEHPATSAMEVLVHVEGELPDDLVLIKLQLPDDAGLYLEVDPQSLPPGWDTEPSSPEAAAFGDRFVAEGQYLGMFVPSVLMPEERNLILNPAHQAMNSVRVLNERPFQYDPRLGPPKVA